MEVTAAAGPAMVAQAQAPEAVAQGPAGLAAPEAVALVVVPGLERRPR